MKQAGEKVVDPVERADKKQAAVEQADKEQVAAEQADKKVVDPVVGQAVDPAVEQTSMEKP